MVLARPAVLGDGGVFVGHFCGAPAPCGTRPPLLPICSSSPAGCRGDCGSRASLLRKSVTAGLSSTSFCVEAHALAVLGLRLRRLARLPQQVAECGRSSPPGRGGRRSRPRGRRPALPGRPAPACKPPGFGGLPSLTGATPDTTGSPPAWPARRSAPTLPPAATPPAGRTPAPPPSCRSLRAGLRPRSSCARRRPWPGRRLPAPPPRLAHRQHRTMRRQGVLVAADLARQLGQLEVGLRRGPPRIDVGLLVEQGTSLP